MATGGWESPRVMRTAVHGCDGHAGVFSWREERSVGIQSLAPQVRVSLDGKWLAWRPVAGESATWTVIALAGNEASGHLTDRAVQDWHALVAAGPLIEKWNDEIKGCTGDEPVEMCPECTGLAIALGTLQEAARP